MKRPLISLALLAALLGASGWLLARRSAPEPAAVSPATEAPPAPVRRDSDSAARQGGGNERVRALEGELLDERRARARAEADADEARNRTASLADKVMVSLGTIDDIGRRTGAVLPALHDLHALASRDRATLTPEEKRRLLDLQRKHADVLGMLPEIAGFQDNPEEYGRFFRTMLQQSAALNDAQASQVETFMRQRGESLVQLGLNTAREPTDPQLEEKWEDQRDAFNEQTAGLLQRILPPGAADKAGLTAELMEFLEMDFDKLKPESPARP